MNKKIISFTLALVFIIQPIAVLAGTQFHLMDKEQLILKAEQLEEKNEYLEKYTKDLEKNQHSDWTRICDHARGAGYSMIAVSAFVGFFYIKKKLFGKR